jgi:hypothetical protein
LALSSGTVAKEKIKEYIEEQERQIIDDRRVQSTAFKVLGLEPRVV